MLALNQTSLPRVATKRLTRRKTCDTKEAPKLRAREKSLSVVSYRQKGQRPQCYTRAERARARARARAKYPGHFRPAKKRPHQWIFEFFLRDWLELDEILPIIATKNQKIEENLRKKFVSKIAKSEQIASNCCFLPLKIEEKLKKNLHCLAVRTEIRTGNFFILPKIADHRRKYRLSNKSLTGGSLRILTYSV